MPEYHIVDTSALLAVTDCTNPVTRPDLLDKLGQLADSGPLILPKAVVEELKVLGRQEFITAWACGISKGRRMASTAADKIAVMNILQLEMGCETGLENADGSDPSIIEVIAIAHAHDSIRSPFVVVSEDRGTMPLRPTMEQICGHTNWTMLGVREGLKNLGFEQYLVQDK